MQPLVLRLSPGTDLRLALEQRVRDEAWPGGFVVSGIGSLTQARLRFAGNAEPTALAGDLELLTLAGSLSVDGAHLHASVADAHGTVRGGHVCAGCIVRTTAELLIARFTDQRLSRELDPATGFTELVIVRLRAD